MFNFDLGGDNFESAKFYLEWGICIVTFKDSLRDLNADLRMIILKWILGKLDLKVWAVFT
jgi:hypothetical protein